jgi:hypothetical protein
MLAFYNASRGRRILQPQQIVGCSGPTKYGPVQIVAVEQVPVIPVLEIDVLCQDAQTARALDDAWWAYTETSPHRPRSMEEALIWGEQFNLFPNIPRDWTC